MRIPFSSFATAACLAVLSLPAMASETYTYTGNPMSTVYVAGDGYSTSDDLTGWFTTATPLSDNLSFSEVTFLSYSFSDGVQTLTNLNSTGLYGADSLEVSTNASGQIVDWNFGFEANSAPLDEVYGSNDPSNLSGQDLLVEDNGQMGTGSIATGTVTGAIGNMNDAGTWVATATASAAPEPSSLILLGTGLLGAFGVARRRFNFNV